MVWDGAGTRVAGAGWVMTCIKCGGYAWGGVDTLCKPCPSRPPSRDLAQQRNRPFKGLFPSWAKQYRGWRVSDQRAPAPSDLLALVRAAKKGVRVLDDAKAVDGLPGENLGLQRCCAPGMAVFCWSGILSERGSFRLVLFSLLGVSGIDRHPQ